MGPWGPPCSCLEHAATNKAATAAAKSCTRECILFLGQRELRGNRQRRGASLAQRQRESEMSGAEKPGVLDFMTSAGDGIQCGAHADVGVQQVASSSTVCGQSRDERVK